ncbi:MAG: sigma-E processing peptidase SpoIIGA [Clostridia bacterium]|nr:sigma-E processing peptidase SpoIIGA [Clostridia bacterium]
MTVYVDILIITNLFISFLILQITNGIMSGGAGFVRLLLGAFIGALSSLIIFLPEMGLVISLLLKGVCAVLIILSSFGFCGIARFMRMLLIFFTASFIFAGVFSALWLFVLPVGLQYRNSIVYLDISPVLLTVSAAVCYGLISLAERLFSKKLSGDRQTEMVVTVGGASVRLNGLVDSGNRLRDAVTGLPCAVAEYDSIKRLFDDDAAGFMKSGDLSRADLLNRSWAKRIRLISYDSVGGEGLLPAFRPDEVMIGGKKVSCIVAVKNKSLSKDGCCALIPPELLCGGDLPDRVHKIRKRKGGQT